MANRVRTCFGLLLLLSFGPLAAQESPDLPKKADLSRIELKKPHLRNYALPEGVAAVEKPPVHQTTIGRFQLLLIDVNKNDRFDEIGLDGWSIAGRKYMFPLEESIVLGTDEIRLKVAENGLSLRYRSDPIQARREYLDTLVLLNDLRMRNGLPPATLDKKLSEACEKHSAYMDRNGMTHEENPNASGYTVEGAEAGRRSCIHSRPILESAQCFYDTLYHRIPIMHPDTRAYGIGSAAKHSSIDGMRGREMRSWQWPVVTPAPDSEGHPVSFNRAGEDPMPYSSSLSPGCPIVVAFESAEVSKVEAEVREGGPKGRKIDILLSSPGKPACRELADNYKCIGIIPRSRLQPSTLYAVRVAYVFREKPVELSWTFKTGGP